MCLLGTLQGPEWGPPVRPVRRQHHERHPGYLHVAQGLPSQGVRRRVPKVFLMCSSCVHIDVRWRVTNVFLICPGCVHVGERRQTGDGRRLRVPRWRAPRASQPGV